MEQRSRLQPLDSGADEGRPVLSLRKGWNDEFSLLAVGSLAGIEVVPVSAAVAVQSTRLPGEFHKDPADRMIAALACERNATLVTADEKIRAYPHVRVAW